MWAVWVPADQTIAYLAGPPDALMAEIAELRSVLHRMCVDVQAEIDEYGWSNEAAWLRDAKAVLGRRPDRYWSTTTVHAEAHLWESEADALSIAKREGGYAERVVDVAEFRARENTW
jgi:hypothetical protein